MGIVGIIGAMASEVERLTELMEDRAVMRAAGIRFYYGTLMGAPVVVAQCGIGKCCAAICAQAMIDKFHVEALINTGVAGGVAPGLRVGDLVVSTDVVQHDFNLTAFGHVQGFMGGTGEDQEPTRFQADERLIQVFKQAAETVLTENRTIDGTIASGDIFVSDEAIKQKIRTRFQAAAVEMEGAAIAQTAAANGVPFVVVRAISDLAGEEAHMSFEEFEKNAAEISARIVMAMLTKLEKGL